MNNNNNIVNVNSNSDTENVKIHMLFYSLAGLSRYVSVCVAKNN
jgi:hypothetical protein